jgi:hypothetical protein
MPTLIILTIAEMEGFHICASGLLECMQYKGVRFNMAADSPEYESFGMTTDISACCRPPSVSQLSKNGPVPSVDHTYKLYYGGFYRRPDGNSSRVVLDGAGKVCAAVADGSR